MTSWGGLNRRKFPRVNYPCLIIIRQNDETKDVMLTHTENVGIGGVCVTLKKGFKIFSPVDVELDLLDMGDHIKCQGKVVWSVQRRGEEKKKPLFFDTGIEFVDLSQKDFNRIQAVIERLVARELAGKLE